MPDFESPTSDWSAAERELAERASAGETVVVNVRKSGPHKHLMPWLVEEGLIVYIGHSGNRHSWPESDFANPFVAQRQDRDLMITKYREWLVGQRDLLDRLRAGELTGKALGCWCAPLPCHGDVLVEEIDRVA
ncbi:uncharacterized protein DUF4326 [Herbihabitans rhizosphaerae]|uniref:Uncharacterized protein DUF4326 n=1 Tax=Herbihabitans rhizosphaerae TaxID=1872711 RepID=A0A4Q7L3J0_9PSEU|nr:DUF4326 domain-containing protein [Herbihabitans rhizosphaerae]RZS44149.1 uncharacterized protein DUF4326 [Herbihabitans rhizosphaerae]